MRRPAGFLLPDEATLNERMTASPGPPLKTPSVIAYSPHTNMDYADRQSERHRCDAAPVDRMNRAILLRLCLWSNDVIKFTVQARIFWKLNSAGACGLCGCSDGATLALDRLQHSAVDEIR